LKNTFFIRPVNFHFQDSSDILLGTILIVLITFTTWLTYHAVFWHGSVHHVISILTKFGRGAYYTTLNQANSVQMTSQDMFFLLIKMHGHHILYLGLTLIGSLMIIKKARGSHDKTMIGKLMLVVVILAALAFFMLANLFGGTTIAGYWRMLSPIVLNVSPVLGYLGYEAYIKLIQNTDNTNRPPMAKLSEASFYIGTIAIFLLAFSFGMFSFHPAPHTYRLNQQISKAELQGMDWFIQHRDEKVAIDSFSTTSKAIFGIALQGLNYVVAPDSEWSEFEAQEHFDYSQKGEAEDLFPIHYLLIHQYDQLFHTMIPRNPVRWLQSDFEQLEHTLYMDKVYANGESVLWVVYPEEAQAK
jgi:hypothetical protein